MSEKLEPSQDERRRRIDELFADEPFLSATMKAKRLHEKLEAGPVSIDARPSKGSGAALTDPWRDRTEAPVREIPIDEPQTLSLSEAREFLRIETNESVPESTRGLDRQNEILLRNLKDGVLATWIKEMKAA